MYGLPEDFDATGFVGKTVEYVSFSSNNIYIFFEENLSLTIEGSFEHLLPEESTNGIQMSVPVCCSCLMRLIGHEVIKVKTDQPCKLTLVFDDHQELRCIDDSNMYESFRIEYFGRDIIV
jgi:hypothetical protein